MGEKNKQLLSNKQSKKIKNDIIQIKKIFNKIIKDKKTYSKTPHQKHF